MPRLLAGCAASLIGALALALSLAAMAGGAAAPVPVCLSPAVQVPTAEEAPSGARVVVCVGASAITEASVTHWLVVDEHSESHEHSHRHVGAVRAEVLSFLIVAEWIKSEATALKIFASPVEVRRRFDRIRHEQFPKRREFEAFLHSSGQTINDLFFRVEQSLLSARIQRHVLGAHHTRSGRQRAFSEWVAAFRARWKMRTVCIPAFSVSDCGRVQATL